MDRARLPLQALPSWMFTTVGKAIALLWALILEVGLEVIGEIHVISTFPPPSF